MALETLLVGLREDWKGEGDYGRQNGCSKEGLVDETEIERSFGLLLLPYCVHSIEMERDCPHSLFPHQQVLLGRWRQAEHYSGQQVDSGNGERPSLSWGSLTYIPIIPIANLSFKFNWFFFLFPLVFRSL